MIGPRDGDLPIFVAWMDFLTWLLPTTAKLPKHVRFSFANRIDNLALDVAEDLVEARYSRNKGSVLARANLRLEKLRILLRLCHQLGYFPHARFLFHLEPNLLGLQQELRAGAYRMRPYRAFEIREPKRRRICVAHFRDWVVHHAVCGVLDSIFESGSISDTYACRRGKGTHAAVRRLQEFSRCWPYVLYRSVI